MNVIPFFYLERNIIPFFYLESPERKKITRSFLKQEFCHWNYSSILKVAIYQMEVINHPSKLSIK